MRKIDANLDLSRHLKEFADLPRPWDQAVLFGRRGPLELEVGSGKGLFLRTAAAAQPEVDFLGIEIARRYARFAASQLARQGLTNAVVVIADAVRVLAEVIPDGAIQAIHIYFPDPWWKRRHKKRRIMVDSFVRDIERTLAPGGRCHFWSDVEEYFRSSLELVAAATNLEGPFAQPEAPAAHEMDYRTHFERRMRLHGLPVFRAQFRKGT